MQPISVMYNFFSRTAGQPSGTAVLGLAVVLLTAVFLTLAKKRPPGPRLLLPFIGETLAVKDDPCGYFVSSYLRYGGVYCTSMLGMQVYVVLEPAAVREVLRGAGTTFSVPFASFNALLEDWDHMVDGSMHDFWRKSIATALSPASIEGCVPRLARIIQSSVDGWAERGSTSLMHEVRRGSTSLMHETGEMALEFAIEVLVGVPLAHTDRAWFKARVLEYLAGLYALPLPLPGTTFSKARAAKQALLAALSKELQASVAGMLQDAPGADALVGAAAKMLRAGDGTSKHQLLHSDAAFRVDQAAAAACVARLKEREAAAAAAAVSSGSSKASVGSSQVQIAAHASAPLGASAAGDGVAPPNMAEAQLEVLRAQQRLSVENAAMRLLGTLIGAVDTTRYMIFSVLAILGQLPQQVEELRQEQQQVVSSHGPALSQAVLADMPKLEACVREVTRLLPASRVVMRQATERLSLCGVEVPRGAYMICSVDCMHALEPTLWKGPTSIPAGARVPPYMDWQGGLADAFQPERWLGDASSRPRHMLTFGFGPHLCLGMNLVMTEVKLLLAVLLRGGLAWSFADSEVLSRMEVFPGLRPAPGSDKLLITRQQQPLC